MVSKKVIGIIAFVIVVIVVVAAIAALTYKSPSTVPTISAPIAVSVTASTQFTPAGSSVTFTALVTGNATKVVWDFGDGTTSSGTIVNHTYQNPGSYLVEANASNSYGYVTNLAKLFPVTITSPTLSTSIASEASQPVLTFNTTVNKNAPIFSINENALFVLSYLQPPSATNWSLGYYAINFGDGSSAIYSVQYNNTTGTFMAQKVTHSYRNLGIYAVSLTLITYNQTNFMNDLVINKTTSNEYLPTTYLPQVLNGEHYNMSTINTVIVVASNQTAGILKGPGNVLNLGVINVVEVVPGGPFSFDPAIDYDAAGGEIIANVYETLIAYNGSSTSQFVPVIAQQVPSISNGLISPDGLNITFYIKPGLKFANGDPLTVFDVYASMVRTLLFITGEPGTPAWILGQDLLPGGGFSLDWSNGQSLYDNITKAITYNNATQSITFHLLKPDPGFLDYVAYGYGPAIMDYKWLVQHGAGIDFTPSGFLLYTQFGNEANYNTYVQWHTMGSGPYMIGSYLSAQSITLVPNPNFTPIPGVPGFDKIPTTKVYIEWVKDPETALLMIENGEADISYGLPTIDFPILQSLQSLGKLNIYSYPSFYLDFYAFNFDVNITMMQTAFGSQYHIPPHYFANPLIRKAFAYSFNYTNYLDNILGNKKYHSEFGIYNPGMIPKGMVGWVPPQNLTNVPVYNLTLAKQFMMESGMYNVSINIPIPVLSGDFVNYAATAMWAQNLSIMDPNIQATPVYIPKSQLFGYEVPGMNPMPIWFSFWGPDYSYPSDYVNGMYLENFAAGILVCDGVNSTNLINWGYPSEAQELNNMSNLILQAESTSNETLALHLFDQAEQIGVNLTLYVPMCQRNALWYYAPWIQGIQYEENPMYGGTFITLFFYLTKS